MKKQVIILSIFYMTLLYGGCDQENKQPPEENSQSSVVAKVERCPNGHDTIKAVPIEYGLIYRTAQTDEKVNNYEVAYGGCAVDRYGSYKFICTTCGCSTYEKISPARKGMPLWFDKEGKVIEKGKTVVVIK